MGNCLGGQAVQHVSGLSSGNYAVYATNNINGKRISKKKFQAEENVKTQEQLLPWQSQSISLPAPCKSPDYLHCFALTDLAKATRNFRSDKYLGEGGFGKVYKGNIDFGCAGQGMAVAIKKLRVEGLQGFKEWKTEIHYLGTLKHPNLVKLIGYCCENDELLLVYEFLAHGSLEKHLHGQIRDTLPWTVRLRIAADAARGLSFLHDAEKPVIYRDFKTANILLDSDFTAKLSDFGLARDGPTGDKTHVTTRVLGTYGYAAPEYVATGRLTAKSDVYGFGVVLLEILTGTRAVRTEATGVEQKLVEWAMPYLKDKHKWGCVLDQRLDGQYSRKGARQVCSIALHCLSQDPKKRPMMKVVLESLESLLNPKDLPKFSLPCQANSSIKETSGNRQLYPNQAREASILSTFQSPK